jgi:hypothetical protein
MSSSLSQEVRNIKSDILDRINDIAAKNKKWGDNDMGDHRKDCTFIDIDVIDLNDLHRDDK